MNYEADFVPCRSPRGRLALRREGAELVCLAAFDKGGALAELKRLPFTAGTVRYLKLQADPGGSPTAVTARLTNVRVIAGEVVGGLSGSELREGTRYWWWWIPCAAASFAAAFGLRRARRLGPEAG